MCAQLADAENPRNQNTYTHTIVRCVCVCVFLFWGIGTHFTFHDAKPEHVTCNGDTRTTHDAA